MKAGRRSKGTLAAVSLMEAEAKRSILLSQAAFLLQDKDLSPDLNTLSGIGRK